MTTTPLVDVSCWSYLLVVQFSEEHMVLSEMWVREICSVWWQLPPLNSNSNRELTRLDCKSTNWAQLVSMSDADDGGGGRRWGLLESWRMAGWC
ncbi:hypothetical protein MRB53_013912 [Persea americana]|uniref:Uncharacterized protein n=1 Tax=Persea americana TaxID=3435 RepID=A0ACC2K9H4_PERAE|nr:hypothetical protein MRB53_013912 [Persea americana]